MKVYGQLEKALLENTSSDVASLPEGLITYRTDLDIVKVSDGSVMVALINESSTQSMSNKTLTTPAIDNATTYNTIATPSNPAANHYKLYFKSSDGRLYKLSSTGTESVIEGATAYQESLGTGNDVITSFGPLTYVPNSEDSILVVVNGLIVEKTDWSLVVSDIVFTSPPASNANVYVYYLTNNYTSSPPPIINGLFKAEYKTLSAGDITAKKVTLGQTPVSPSDVMLDVVGNTSQIYGVDYSVSGNELSWNGTPLDGLLLAGDVLRVAYVY